MEKRLCECGCGQEVKNRFVSGHNGKGVPLSDKHRDRISKSKMGHFVSNETRLKKSKSMTGKRHSEETKKKMSNAHKGKTFTEETRRRISEAHRGMKASPETLIKLSESHIGKKPSKESIRTREITRFENRKGFTRTDGYCDVWGDVEYRNDCKKDKCERCGMEMAILPTKTKGKRYNTLRLHHIDEDKMNCHPDNFQTLCCSCHLKVHWELRKQNINQLR